jgi:uncharacterized protein involved in exopolysaccharide biosynthesis
MKAEEISGQVHEKEDQGSPAPDLHLLDWLIILSKRRKFIFGFTAVVAILATIVAFLIPSQYTATTVVLPPGQNSSMSSVLMGQLGNSGALASYATSGLGMRNVGEMYVSLFRSRTIEDSVVQRFGLMAKYRKKRMSDARKAFEDHSTVTLGAKDGLLRITITDRNPREAAEIANGYVEEYRKLSSNLAITEASQRRLFFQQQLLEARQNLTAAEEAMKSTEQATGVLQIDSQSKSLIESAAVLRGQVVAKEVQIQAMRSYATDDNPELILVKQQLSALKAQLTKLAGVDQDSGHDFIVPKGKIPEAGMEYIRKLRDVKYYETITELIAKQFEIAKLDEARQGAVIQVADLAVPPDKKSFPRIVPITLVASLAGLVLAISFVLCQESLTKFRQSPESRHRLEALATAWSKPINSKPI